MPFRALLVWPASLCIVTACALGQSVNIRFGSAASSPAATYAAAGLAGTWNTFQVPTASVLQPLVDLNGAPIPAQFYQMGNASILSFDNPLTSGDDEKLLDSMILSTNSPTDGCFWVVGLTLGQYEVTIYVMTPDNPALLNRTRVDNGTPGPVMVGGTWPGHHQSGVTSSRFTVTPIDGVIAFHDGLAGGNMQSGMNAVQLEYLPPGGARAIMTANIPAAAVISGEFHAAQSRHRPRRARHARLLPLRRPRRHRAAVRHGHADPLVRPVPRRPGLARRHGLQSVGVAGVNPMGAISSNGTSLVIGPL